jgi:hypothetical protein
MYRKVTAYTKDQEQKKGMIEQVCPLGSHDLLVAAKLTPR